MTPLTKQSDETQTAFALRQIQHEAWVRGEAAGWSRAMRHMSDEPSVGRATNPYADPTPSPIPDAEHVHEADPAKHESFGRLGTEMQECACGAYRTKSIHEAEWPHWQEP